jgi:hypothetical protein
MAVCNVWWPIYSTSDGFTRKCQGLLILCESAAGASIYYTRELIQNDDLKENYFVPKDAQGKFVFTLAKIPRGVFHSSDSNLPLIASFKSFSNFSVISLQRKN